MDVQVIPTTSFAHNEFNCHEGRPHRMPLGIAQALERKGLVRIDATQGNGQMQALLGAGMRVDAMIAHGASGKASGDGQGQPSPSLLPAPVSPRKIAPVSKRGAKRTGKSAR